MGVFARRGAHVEVVEYSEMDPQEAASVDPSRHSDPTCTTLVHLTSKLQVQLKSQCSACNCSLQLATVLSQAHSASAGVLPLL